MVNLQSCASLRWWGGQEGSVWWCAAEGGEAISFQAQILHLHNVLDTHSRCYIIRSAASCFAIFALNFGINIVRDRNGKDSFVFSGLSHRHS